MEDTKTPEDPGGSVEATLAVLATIFQSLSSSFASVVKELEEERFYRKETNKTQGMLVVMFIIAMVIFVLGGFAIGLLVVKAIAASETNGEAVRIMVECTTPGDLTATDKDAQVHECYDQAQRNQAQVLSVLDQTNQQRQQEFLDALRTGASIIQRAPAPVPSATTTTTTGAPPAATTTTTTTRTTRGGGRETTTTTAASPPSTATTTTTTTTAPATSPTARCTSASLPIGGVSLCSQ